MLGLIWYGSRGRIITKAGSKLAAAGFRGLVGVGAVVGDLAGAFAVGFGESDVGTVVGLARCSRAVGVGNRHEECKGGNDGSGGHESLHLE